MNSNGSERINLPTAFPAGNYTPHGYIDNPYHSMVFNRSGVIRSVPPLGFGQTEKFHWFLHAHSDYRAKLKCNFAAYLPAWFSEA